MSQKTAKEWVEFFSLYPEDELIGISSIADRDDFKEFVSNIKDDPENEHYETINTKDMNEIYRSFIVEFERDEYLAVSAWETKSDIFYRLLSKENK
jgi:hypothetical protein